MSDLVLKNVCKSYHKGEQQVVKGVSLEVKAGELVSFLGPSGCGKTTILRMIAGLLLPDSGTIHILNKEVAKLPSYKRDIGMVFQNYALFPHLTVQENVAFGLKMRKTGMNRADIKQQTEAILETVNLKGFGSRYPKQLSGGQQQRVALARALVIKPAVLLLDEPLSALDAKLRHETREEIKRLQRELGVATVFVTHDQEEAMALSDRVAILSNGLIQQYDKPETIFEQPENVFVARFMGISNIFSAVPAGDNRYRLDGDVIIVAGRHEPDLHSIGIRPEKLKVRLGSHDMQESNSFRGKVVRRSYSGMTVKLEIQAVPDLTFTSVVPADSEAAKAVEGTAVTVYWQPEDTLLLRPENVQ
ncbi:ABC transporter ATP-binding protein [Paenibacillus jiagnxiensis]|uniref:ABC transporter ATP-binding protein n=1 Tax=Paenibacillus jiagnxiensis TaxID=3228926 RepID=UPI0033A7EF32